MTVAARAYSQPQLSSRYFVAGAVRGDSHHRPQTPHPSQRRPQLRRGLGRDQLLSLPAHRRLRADRLRLHHRPQEVQRPHVLGRLLLPHAAEVRPHPPGADSGAEESAALLHPQEDERHLDAVLRQSAERGVRLPAGDGRGQVWVLIIVLRMILL